MNNKIVKVVATQGVALPKYETEASAGMDVRANITEPVVLSSLERKIIPTGLKIELPIGMECQVRPRSGLAAKQGITVLNAPGTVDADYRGEVGVILVNLSSEDVTIHPQDRIAQLVFAQHEQISWETVTELSTTDRGSGGFGSTGKS